MAPIELRPADIERFHEKVGPPSENGCRLWTGEVNNNGYGRLVIYRGNGRRRLLAHRLAFEFATGIDPGPAKLLHSCDTPPCCEPSHLRRGTQAENMADAKTKGRTVDPPRHAGADHPHAKLSELDVETIRRIYNEGGVSQQVLGERYGVTQSAIGYIVRGRTWSGLPVPRNPKGARRTSHCGTNSGYARHRRTGEKPCGACAEAKRAYSADRYERVGRARQAELRAQRRLAEKERRGVDLFGDEQRQDGAAA